MLGAYHADLRRKYDPARNDGVTDCQLAWSRDSVRWERWPEPFIPRGEPGAFDRGGVYCQYPAIRGDRIYFLYTGNNTWHGRRGESTLGLAALRLDGFVSVQSAGFTEGVVVTRPHHWKARELRVNAQSLTGGLKVQLQDETGRAFDGFSTAEVEPVRADSVDALVSWKGGTDLRSFAGKMVALRFTLGPEDRLYSYTLAPASD